MADIAEIEVVALQLPNQLSVNQIEIVAIANVNTPSMVVTELKIVALVTPMTNTQRRRPLYVN
jgi:hypothetical protein